VRTDKPGGAGDEDRAVGHGGMISAEATAFPRSGSPLSWRFVRI
jgi:hypothetical protein